VVVVEVGTAFEWLDEHQKTEDGFVVREIPRLEVLPKLVGPGTGPNHLVHGCSGDVVLYTYLVKELFQGVWRGGSIFIPCTDEAAIVAHVCPEVEVVEITEEALAVTEVALAVQTA